MHDEGFSFLTSMEDGSVGLIAEADMRDSGENRLASLALAVHLRGALTIGFGLE